MYCQLAHIVATERTPELLGYYLWVEDRNPTIMATDHDKSLSLASRIFHTPYIHNGKQIVVLADSVQFIGLRMEIEGVLDYAAWKQRKGERYEVESGD